MYVLSPALRRFNIEFLIFSGFSTSEYCTLFYDKKGIIKDD